jgi:hypothetical protein
MPIRKCGEAKALTNDRNKSQNYVYEEVKSRLNSGMLVAIHFGQSPA